MMLTRLDSLTNNLATSIENPALTAFSKAIDVVFDPFVIIIFLLAISVYLFHSNILTRKKGVILASTTIISTGIVYFLKNIIGRARPLNGIIEASNFSLPSGHTTFIIIFLGGLIYAFTSGESRKKAIYISIPIILIVALSRIYLRLHFLTDIITSIILGGIIIAGMMAADKRF